MQSDFEKLDNVCRYLAGMSFTLDYISEPINKRLDQMQIDFCYCLKNTGARFAEIKNRAYVVAWDGTNVTIQAAKGGNQFTVHKSLLASSYIDYIESGLEIYPTCRNESFTRHLHNAVLPYTFFAGNRPLIKHIFRYCHIISLHRFGMSDSEISATIGESDDKNTKGYWENEPLINP